MTLAQLKKTYYRTFTPEQKIGVSGLIKDGLDEGEAILTVVMRGMRVGQKA